MATIKAQSVPTKTESAEDILARFCYYFQQYTYQEASRLPFKRVKKMLSSARKERAKMMYDLTMIAAAPHTRNGEGVKKLAGSFKEVMDGD